jgi:exonuclease-1
MLTCYRFVDFAMHRVRMLQHFGVIPYLVFDGDYLPSKAATEADRAKRRSESKKFGMELLKAGKTVQAHRELQKAVDVTPEMAHMLIEELKKVGVQYVVAPYEADAQMVYLERKGIISAILSEDSDLLVFGAKCLLTKLDNYGNCEEYSQADFAACQDINLAGWSEKEFRHMAILSGCDYLASINNMGLKTAHRMIRKHKTVDKVIRMLQFDGKFTVPQGYLDAFYQAELTFLHQRVYCPLSEKLVYHTEPEQPLDENITFIGSYVTDEVARKVAKAELNPITKKPMMASTVQYPMEAPRTPWGASKQQFQRRSASDDLKKGVSIEQFFKARRTPLAELDPNCFTPSPSQQNALARNQGPWTASPAPRPYLNRTVTNPELELPQSAPQPPRAPLGRALRSISGSETRPSKRARLCENDLNSESLNDGLKVNLGRSRFFGSPTAEPSPSVRSRKQKKDEIQIFSDDSIEEAMLGLPEFDDFPAKPKKLEILADVTLEQTATFSQDDCPPSLTHSASTLSATSEPTSTPRSNCAAKPSISIKQQFAFTPKAPFSSLSSSPLPTSPSSIKPSRLPLAVNALSAIHRIPTPLQSLGNKALSRPSILETRPYTPTLNNRKPSFPRSSLGSCSANRKTSSGVPFAEVTVSISASPKSKTPKNDPIQIPLPAADENEISALGVGSEDLIVGDSDLQDEIERRMALRRFVFKA